MSELKKDYGPAIELMRQLMSPSGLSKSSTIIEQAVSGLSEEKSRELIKDCVWIISSQMGDVINKKFFPLFALFMENYESSLTGEEQISQIAQRLVMADNPLFYEYLINRGWIEQWQMAKDLEMIISQGKAAPSLRVLEILIKHEMLPSKGICNLLTAAISEKNENVCMQLLALPESKRFTKKQWMGVLKAFSQGDLLKNSALAKALFENLESSKHLPEVMNADVDKNMGIMQWENAFREVKNQETWQNSLMAAIKDKDFASDQLGFYAQAYIKKIQDEKKLMDVSQRHFMAPKQVDEPVSRNIRRYRL